MTRRFNPYLAALLAAGSLALALPAAAQAHGMGGHHAGPGHEMGGGKHRGIRFLRGLDLTEAQRDQVFKILHEQAPTMREHAKAARSAHEDLRKAAAATDFDRARARELADAAARAHAELALLRAESMSKVLAILTPEQRAKLEERRERGPRGHRR